jgi:hypothetical protein
LRLSWIADNAASVADNAASVGSIVFFGRFAILFVASRITRDQDGPNKLQAAPRARD